MGGRLEYGQTKSYAVRQLPLTPALLAQLETHLTEVGAEPEAPLFVSPDGGPLRHSNFYHRLWRPALRNLGLPEVGLHVLRHSAAARMIGAGASPKAVQVVLGHRSAAFTLTVYGHLLDADLDDLALRLDGEPGPVRRFPRPGRGLSRPTRSRPQAEAPKKLPRPAISPWARQGSNLRPRDYESPALTN